jgi:hypothetical protein
MGNEVYAQIALNSLGWETLKVQRTKANAKLMFKILNKSWPKRLTDLFTYKNENTHYCLRDNETTLVLPQPRTISMKKSFMFNGQKYGIQCLKKSEITSQPLFERKIAAHVTKLYIYIYIYRQVSSLESYMSRVLNTVVELIRLEDKLELLHMNFISLL